jgi:hypothetical protein
MERFISLQQIFRGFCQKYVIAMSLSLVVSSGFSQDKLQQEKIDIESYETLEFTPLGDYQVIAPGLITNIKFKAQQEIPFQRLVGEKIAPIFFLLEVDKKSLKVLVTETDKDKETLKVGDQAFRIKIKGFDYRESKNQIKDFIFEEMEIQKSWFEKYLYLVILLAVLLMGLFLGWTFYQKLKFKKAQQRIKTNMQQKILKAELRPDFEELYSLRKELEEYQIIDDCVLSLLKEINKIQYKPQWTEEDAKVLVEKKQVIVKNWEQHGV